MADDTFYGSDLGALRPLRPDITRVPLPHHNRIAHRPQPSRPHASHPPPLPGTRGQSYN